MSQPGTEYLQHILEEIDYLLAAVGKRECSEFLVDETLKRATARSLSIIGEAAKKVPSELKSDFALVPWVQMAAMRDKLVHDYFGIDYEIVWDVVNNELPRIKGLVLSILEDLGK